MQVASTPATPKDMLPPTEDHTVIRVGGVSVMVFAVAKSTPFQECVVSTRSTSTAYPNAWYVTPPTMVDTTQKRPDKAAIS